MEKKLYLWNHMLNVVKVENTYLASVRGKKYNLLAVTMGDVHFFLFRQPL